MEITDALDFVQTNHHAVLATRRSNGEIAQSPVLAVADDHSRVLISTRETAMKVRHLRADPRAWLCAIPDTFFGDWVHVAGPVQIISLPEAMDVLIDYYRLANGEHEDWDEYRAAMEQQKRCVVVITPDRVGPTMSG